jgi:hypothetical protein
MFKALRRRDNISPTRDADDGLGEDEEEQQPPQVIIQSKVTSRVIQDKNVDSLA